MSAVGEPQLRNRAVCVVPSGLTDFERLALWSMLPDGIFFPVEFPLFAHGIGLQIARGLGLISVQKSHGDGAIAALAETVGTGGSLVLSASPSRGARDAVEILFHAEEQASFLLNAQCIPVNIRVGYTLSGGRRVELLYHEPLTVSAWKERFEFDAQNATQNLASQIERQLSAKQVDSREAEFRSFISSLGAMPALAARAIVVAHDAEQGADNARRLLRRIEDCAAILGAKPLPELGISRFAIIGASTIGMLVHAIPGYFLSLLDKNAPSYSRERLAREFSHARILIPLWYGLLAVVVLGTTKSIVLSIGAFSFFVACVWIARQYGEAVVVKILAHLWPGTSDPAQVKAVMTSELLEALERYEQET